MLAAQPKACSGPSVCAVDFIAAGVWLANLKGLLLCHLTQRGCAQIVCTLKGMAAALRPPRTRAARPAPPPASASSAASSEICAAAVLAQSTHGERIGAGPRPAEAPPASYAAVVAALPAAGDPRAACRGPPAAGPLQARRSSCPTAARSRRRRRRARLRARPPGCRASAAGRRGCRARRRRRRGRKPLCGRLRWRGSRAQLWQRPGAARERAAGVGAGASACGGAFRERRCGAASQRRAHARRAEAGPFGVAQQLGYPSGHMGGAPAAGAGSSAHSTPRQSHGAG